MNEQPGAQRPSSSSRTSTSTSPGRASGPGERGAEPHVHREHTDAFYVLEGELTFRIGPEASSRCKRRGRHVCRRSPERRPRLLDSGAAVEARFLNFHAPSGGFADYMRGKGSRLRQLPPPENGGSAPRSRDRRADQAREKSSRAATASTRSRGNSPTWRRSSSLLSPASRASSRTPTTTTWTRSSSSAARCAFSPAREARARSSRPLRARCMGSRSRTTPRSPSSTSTPPTRGSPTACGAADTPRSARSWAVARKGGKRATRRTVSEYGQAALAQDPAASRGRRAVPGFARPGARRPGTRAMPPA